MKIHATQTVRAHGTEFHVAASFIEGCVGSHAHVVGRRRDSWAYAFNSDLRQLHPGETAYDAVAQAVDAAVAAVHGDDGYVAAIPICDCGRDRVGNVGTHCLECELEPFGVAWQLEQDGRL